MAKATTTKATAKRPARSVTGRPSTLTQAVHKAIVASLENGAPITAAAAAAGVSEGTVRDWLNKGRTAPANKPHEPFTAFATAVDAAQEKAVGVAFNALYAQGLKGEWRALEAWLRLMYPRRYGRRITMEMDEVMTAAERVARELGLEGHAADIVARAQQIALAAGSDRL